LEEKREREERERKEREAWKDAVRT